MSETAYDSRSDTTAHILRVRELLYIVQNKLEARGFAHDQSKLHDPERSIFDEMTPKLKSLTYGSDEYRASLAQMKPALDSHYANNTHHPEHYTNGVDGMSLLDVLEMLLDWKAASERHANGCIRQSIQHNTARFSLAPQLVNLLTNTANELGW